MCIGTWNARSFPPRLFLARRTDASGRAWYIAGPTPQRAAGGKGGIEVWEYVASHIGIAVESGFHSSAAKEPGIFPPEVYVLLGQDCLDDPGCFVYLSAERALQELDEGRLELAVYLRGAVVAEGPAVVWSSVRPITQADCRPGVIERVLHAVLD